MSDTVTTLDWLVLTASSEAQASGYRAELTDREGRGLLPTGCRWLVVPDAGDRRIGSGGSTFIVFEQLARALRETTPGARSIPDLFHGRRIFIIHSGGDSRRLVSYASTGKTFVPLPLTDTQGRGLALFDLVLGDLLDLPCPPGGHLLVATGDVMLGVGGQPFDFGRPGITGVAVRDTLERGSRHGVYIRDADGSVSGFLQKPTPAEARAEGAVVRGRKLLVDTGLVSYDAAAVAHWLDAGGMHMRRGRLETGSGLLRSIHRGAAPPIDLFSDLLLALPTRVDRETFLRRVDADDPDRRRLLLDLYAALHGPPFQVDITPRCDFLHLGSHDEMLGRLLKDRDATSRFGFRHGVGALLPSGTPRRGRSAPPLVYNSVLDDARLTIRGAAIVEGSWTTHPLELAGDNVVVGVPPAIKRPIRLARGQCLACLPVGKTQWAVITHGLTDDFKTTIGNRATWLGRSLRTWLRWIDADPDQLVDGDLADAALWDLRLWITGPINQVVDRQTWMLSADPPPADWLARRRVSLRELMPRVDVERVLDLRTRVRRHVAEVTAPQRIIDDPWLRSDVIAGDLAAPKSAKSLVTRLLDVAETTDDSLAAARLAMTAHVITRTFPRAAAKSRGDLRTHALSYVSRAVEAQIDFPSATDAAAVRPDQAVWVSTPVRIDLAGGWSDTPPVCNELGGTVVNAAIRLNGTDPVQVMAKLTDEPNITLHSVDLGLGATFLETRDLLDYDDPTHWTSLLKAALVLAGVAPRDPRRSLTRRLEQLGGGLALTSFSAVPKGSGLGTSSVLGAAVLACLDRVFGRRFDVESLVERTSVLEQMMHTHGGWQDQIGGLVGGIKITRTRPGLQQVPVTEAIPVPPAALDLIRRRTVFYYTGHRRLAKNILETVVGRYLARDREAVDVIPRLKAGAEAMADSLREGDIDGFALSLGEYWRLKRTLDPASSNDQLEAIVRPHERDLLAWELPGAGGGGFVFMLAKSVRAAEKIRRRLDKKPPNALARSFDFEVATTGMKVAVL